MKTIVVGYDASAAAERALARAAELVERFDSRLVVVTVVPLAPAGPPPRADPFLAPIPPLAVEPAVDLADAREAAEQNLERARAALGDRSLAVEYVQSLGDAADELVAAAEQQAADLIVVGTREPGFLDRLLSGSVSQAVARNAHCDVLIVHPDT